MKKSRFFLSLILPAVALAGCATGYQKEGVFTNGYSDYKTMENTFVVTFRASEHTPAEKAMEFALARAAELTLKNGYRFFSILEETRKGPGLHYPSVRLTIQCYHAEPTDREWLDAIKF